MKPFRTLDLTIEFHEMVRNTNLIKAADQLGACLYRLLKSEIKEFK